MLLRIIIFLSLFLSLPFYVNAQDAKQALNDKLYEATRTGNVAEVKSLLDQGADVNAKFRYGTTALFKAAEKGYTDVVKLLLYQQRLADRGGAFTASMVASDGKIYLSSEDGEIFVVKAGPKHELLSVNPIGEVLMATPAISDGMLIVRGINHVFAVDGNAAAKK